MADSKAGVEDPDHLSKLEIKKVLKITAANIYIYMMRVYENDREKSTPRALNNQTWNNLSNNVNSILLLFTQYNPKYKINTLSHMNINN